MPSSTDRTAGEIDWVTGLDRTSSRSRERTSKFSVTFYEALSAIATELEDRVDVDDWRVSTAAPHRKSDGQPYANAAPDDPAVVIRWSKQGEQYAVASDHYTDWRDNCRAIGLYIREKRKMSDRPVTTGQDEFATARLPSGEEGNAIVAGAAGDPADQEGHYEFLGLTPAASEPAVHGAIRQLKKEFHPDNGGDRDQFRRVVEAERALLE